MSPSLTTDLHMNANGALTPEKTRSDIKYTIRGWHLRPAAQNDAALRNAFCSVLEASALLPPDQRLIMYDAEDGGAISEPLGGPFLRKRLDARRNSELRLCLCCDYMATPGLLIHPTRPYLWLRADHSAPRHFACSQAQES